MIRYKKCLTEKRRYNRGRRLFESSDILNDLKRKVHYAYREVAEDIVKNSYWPDVMDFLNKWEDCCETGEIPDEAYEEFEWLLRHKVSSQSVWDALEIEEGTLTEDEEQELHSYIEEITDNPKLGLGDDSFWEFLHVALGVDY